MKEKYVEQRHPCLEIGIGEEGNERVSIETACGEARLAESVPILEARALILKHNKVLDALVKVALFADKADPEGFGRLWYEEMEV